MYLTSRWEFLPAVEMLTGSAPEHPLLPELVDALTARWVADPRPITLRSQIQRWREEAGLPPAENLPWYWHPAMLHADRLGWPTVPAPRCRPGLAALPGWLAALAPPPRPDGLR